MQPSTGVTESVNSTSQHTADDTPAVTSTVTSEHTNADAPVLTSTNADAVNSDTTATTSSEQAPNTALTSDTPSSTVPVSTTQPTQAQRMASRHSVAFAADVVDTVPSLLRKDSGMSELSALSQDDDDDDDLALDNLTPVTQKHQSDFPQVEPIAESPTHGDDDPL